MAKQDKIYKVLDEAATELLNYCNDLENDVDSLTKQLEEKDNEIEALKDRLYELDNIIKENN